MGGCRNGGQQLVAGRLWCTDHQLGCLVWWLNPACSHERYTPNHYWASIVRDSWLDVPWGIGCIFVSRNPHPAVGYMKQKSALVWPMILRHVLNFQPRRAKHHAKRDRRCRSTNSGRLMTLLDLSPADFRRFLTVLIDRRLLGSQCCLSTGLVANGIRLTKRCNAMSSRSDVTRGLPDLGKSDNSIVVAHLTSNSFEGHPCCMHADYLTSLCFWYSLSWHAYWEWIIFFKTPDLNTMYPNSKRERHGSRAWLVDIRHNGHTCMSTSF